MSGRTPSVAWVRGLDLASLLLASALLASCGASHRPRIMGEVDAVRTGAATQQAKQLAPQAYAHAEQLWQRAEQAHLDDDLAGAQILSEHALAAYNEAFVLARLAKAQKRLADASAKLAKAEQELRALDEQQQRVAAEADDLELRIKVLRDALPLVPNQPTTPERERARLAAARSLSLQAQLLCAATRLLSPDAKSLAEQLEKIQALDQKLSTKPPTVPIDEAITLRSACLRQLTLARRPATRQAPATDKSDELLSELSRVGDLFPFRDDRGVVVTLRGVFTPSGKLTKAGAERVSLLGRIAKAHPDFPVLLVVHSARGRASAGEQAGAKAIAQALTEAGAPTVEMKVASDAQPVVDRSRKRAGARNARVEIVFVSPTS